MTTTELTDSRKRPTDILDLCRTIAANSPIPTAEIDPLAKTIICANLSFCLLTGKSEKALAGSPLSLIVPDGPELSFAPRPCKDDGRAGVPHRGKV